MESKYFPSHLKTALAEPLPGLQAQIRMAGIKRKLIPDSVKKLLRPKKAGVLALFYAKNDEIFLALMKRPDYGGVHSGQVSFPGGKWEETDGSMEETALRETEEEFGILSEKIEILGRLTDLYIPPSNFNVSAFVGFMQEIPEFKPDPEEVDDIIEIRLTSLLDEKCIQEKEITVAGAMKYKAPCYMVDGTLIWGATAMMLSELIEVIQKMGSI